MPQERPIDTYKAIIDELVDETRTGGAAFQIVDKGIFSKAPAQRRFNEFIALLSDEQRKLLSAMLQEERDGAIHDALAVFSWWVVCRKVGFTVDGQSMPVDLSGMGLHGDYVGRREGWNWPDEGESD